ncbi:MAG TPA: hypothetical protein VGD54_00885, partial [Steroidobacteraceae bacterium]
MSDLRDQVLDAHGIARWKTARTIEGDMSITGLLWARKGWPDALKQVHVTADIDSQRVNYQPFTQPDLRSVYRPDAVAIETSDGKSIKNRVNPRAAFQGHAVETAWDDLHLAYFSGYAIWNYLNTPFLFLLPGFKTEEIEPWDEHGEKWRRLKVTFPDSVATHCPEQVFHVNGDNLISRLDYSAPVTGGIPTAHYTSEYRDFDGIRIATKRRAYLRNAAG